MKVTIVWIKKDGGDLWRVFKPDCAKLTEFLKANWHADIEVATLTVEE